MGRPMVGENLPPISYSLISVSLPAGETANYSMVLSELYDLSRPDKYIVTIKKGKWDATAAPTDVVKSNIIAITITP